MQTKRTIVMAVVALVAFASAQEARGQSRILGPVISSVAPQAPVRSPTAQVLSITGVNFSATLTLSVVSPDGGKQTFTGAAIQTWRATSFKVSVVLSAPGAYTLIVTNPDGAASDPFVLKGQPSAQPAPPRAAKGPTPTIDRVHPEQLTKDSQPQAIAITGDHFVQDMSVSLTDPIGTVFLIKGSALGTVTATAFTVSLAIEMIGDYTLMVTTPAGDSSNTITIKSVMRKR